MYLTWLDRYPAARLAAPHFLSASPLPIRDDARGAIVELLRHPKFHAVFSRHGGRGSREPYPHADLIPWVRQVVEHVGWDRILWGSEYPVLYWRDETLPQCLEWISKLLPDIDEEDALKFLGGNAQRLFFAAPGPAAEDVVVPDWVGQQFVWERTIPVLPNTTLELPSSVYYPLLSDFLASPEMEAGKGFAEYVVRQLGERARALRQSK